MNTNQMITKNAIEEINEYSENDIIKSAYYFVNGEKIAYRAWDENQICMEYEIKNEGWCAISSCLFFCFADERASCNDVKSGQHY